MNSRQTIPEYYYNRIFLKEGETYSLEPGEFILGETFEKAGISKKLGMLIERTSTMARLGMTVIQSSMIVDTDVRLAGQSPDGNSIFRPRRITLEIKNSGPNAILLHPKMRIAKAVLFRLETPASREYDGKGKYRDQEGIGAPKPTEKR